MGIIGTILVLIIIYMLSQIGSILNDIRKELHEINNRDRFRL